MPETPPNPDRRALLAGIAALAAVPALPTLALAPAPAARAIHIVDGWVLTSDDVRALGLHAR